ncbi:hypothetical protein Tco_1415054 [Tanacetum coccineum]
MTHIPLDQFGGVTDWYLEPRFCHVGFRAFTVTYTSISRDYVEPSDVDSPGVVVYGYDGLPMHPQSPDYVPGPEHPPSLDYVPGPEHPPSPVYVPYVPEPAYPEFVFEELISLNPFHENQLSLKLQISP